MFKVLKKKKQNTNLELCIQRNYSSKVKEKDLVRQKLREYVISRPALPFLRRKKKKKERKKENYVSHKDGPT